MVFVWNINFHFSGTNTPTCNCLVIWQLQVLRRTPDCFSEWLRHFLLPSAAQSEPDAASLRARQHLLLSLFFILTLVVSVWHCLSLELMRVFLMANAVEHPLCLSAICGSALVTCLLASAHFLIELFAFFTVQVCECFILDTRPLSDIWLVNVSLSLLLAFFFPLQYWVLNLGPLVFARQALYLTTELHLQPIACLLILFT